MVSILWNACLLSKPRYSSFMENSQHFNHCTVLLVALASSSITSTKTQSHDNFYSTTFHSMKKKNLKKRERECDSLSSEIGGK